MVLKARCWFTVAASGEIKDVEVKSLVEPRFQQSVDQYRPSIPLPRPRARCAGSGSDRLQVDRLSVMWSIGFPIGTFPFFAISFFCLVRSFLGGIVSLTKNPGGIDRRCHGGNACCRRNDGVERQSSACPDRRRAEACRSAAAAAAVAKGPSGARTVSRKPWTILRFESHVGTRRLGLQGRFVPPSDRVDGQLVHSGRQIC